MADGSVQGDVHDRYAQVRAVFEENLAKGDDIGASFAATVEDFINAGAAVGARAVSGFESQTGLPFAELDMSYRMTYTLNQG